MSMKIILGKQAKKFFKTAGEIDIDRIFIDDKDLSATAILYQAILEILNDGNLFRPVHSHLYNKTTKELHFFANDGDMEDFIKKESKNDTRKSTK